jgi:hypothetical protein
VFTKISSTTACSEQPGGVTAKYKYTRNFVFYSVLKVTFSCFKQIETKLGAVFQENKDNGRISIFQRLLTPNELLVFGLLISKFGHTLEF